MKRYTLQLVAATFLLAVVVSYAGSSTASASQDYMIRITRSLERIATSLERIERKCK